jgi:hypothetical protein
LDQPAAGNSGSKTGGGGSPPARPPVTDALAAPQAPAESAAAESRLLDLAPPPIIQEYQNTFGGTIVSAKPLPGESPPQD